MAFDIVSFALDFIAAYGLIAILVLLVLDGALLLPVFPGEIVLIMAVAAYAPDIPSLIFLILVTTAAGLVGSLLLYGITRGGGRRLVEKYPRFFMMPRKRRERLERSFQHPLGQSMVFFLRLIPLTRILVNIPAGLARMPLVRFVVLSTLGLLAYHGAFLWFTYEANRAGSPVAEQRQHLEEAYASPAWAFIEANQIIAGLVLLGLGAVVAVRAASRVYKDPEESAGSVVGWLTTLVFTWGGIALAVATYMDPDAVYVLLGLGGVDIESVAASLGYGAAQVLFAVAAVAIVFGSVLARIRRSAKHRREAFLWRRQTEQAEVQRRIAARPTMVQLLEVEEAEGPEDVQDRGDGGPDAPGTDKGADRDPDGTGKRDRDR